MFLVQYAAKFKCVLCSNIDHDKHYLVHNSQILLACVVWSCLPQDTSGLAVH